MVVFFRRCAAVWYSFHYRVRREGGAVLAVGWEQHQFHVGLRRTGQSTYLESPHFGLPGLAFTKGAGEAISRNVYGVEREILWYLLSVARDVAARLRHCVVLVVVALDVCSSAVKPGGA